MVLPWLLERLEVDIKQFRRVGLALVPESGWLEESPLQGFGEKELRIK
jgi:hypothetical protein